MHSKSFPLIIAALFLNLAACQGKPADSDATPAAPITIQAYQPDKAVAQDLLKALQVARFTDQHIFADATPNGTIIVAAPAKIQSDVRDLLKLLQKTTPASPVSVAVDYWIVEAVPGGETEHPSGMAAIGDALEAIQRSNGKQRFRLLERLGVVASGPSAESSLVGRDTHISQQLDLRGNDIWLSPDITFWYHSSAKDGATTRSKNHRTLLTTSLLASPDKLLVIGQSGADSSDGPVTLYYIVRAHLL